MDEDKRQRLFESGGILALNENTKEISKLKTAVFVLIVILVIGGIYLAYVIKTGQIAFLTDILRAIAANCAK